MSELVVRLMTSHELGRFRSGDVFTETAGCSAIWSPDGLAVARAGPGVGDVAAAALA